MQIDLIVRGFCCLRAGVPGLSDHIRVRSVLGRFLEHTRVYYFHNAGQEEFYIGSADWMVRNLDYRVEAITPIEDAAHRATIRDILDASLNDPNAWHLQPDGQWQRTGNRKEAEHTQEVLMRRTLEAAARQPRI